MYLNKKGMLIINERNRVCGEDIHSAIESKIKITGNGLMKKWIMLIYRKVRTFSRFS